MPTQARRVRRGVLALGLAGAVALAASPAAAAQASLGDAGPPSAWPRLTVQPRTMATGTQNPAAGEYALQSVRDESRVFVPPACVGAKRCPLLVFYEPSQGVPFTMRYLNPVASRQGIIVLVVDYVARLDDYLKETLQRFAIDPAKIAILGHCGTGTPALRIGAQNLHVFSRIAAMSATVTPMTYEPIVLDPRNTTAEFYLEDAFREGMAEEFFVARRLQQEGHPVRNSQTIRDHAFQPESFELLGRWLTESWAKPPAARPAPTVLAPVRLTREALAQLTTFWTRFFQLPDSAWTVERRLPYIRDVAVSVDLAAPAAVGAVAPTKQIRSLLSMIDMAALAARYPSVAAALAQAGLTGQQHDAYRVALATALGTGTEISVYNPGRNAWEKLQVDPTSVLVQNIAFVQAHPDELQALEAAGRDPAFATLGHSHTRWVTPLGIWLTP